jgi:hypothetical protein
MPRPKVLHAGATNSRISSRYVGVLPYSTPSGVTRQISVLCLLEYSILCLLYGHGRLLHLNFTIVATITMAEHIFFDPKLTNADRRVLDNLAADVRYYSESKRPDTPSNEASDGNADRDGELPKPGMRRHVLLVLIRTSPG